MILPLVLVTAFAFQQSPSAAAPSPPSAVLAIRAGTLIDGNLDILQTVQFVMKSGRVFKRDGQVLGRSAAGVP